LALGGVSRAISDLDVLLRTMEPVLHEGVYVYAVVPLNADLTSMAPVATFREPEGMTIIASEAEALRADLRIIFRAAWITLKVHSDLQAVGLTAAFSRALSEAGISCNVVAAAHHDHIFVPVECAQQALARLRALQEKGSQ
jgi:hypothetical protein